MEILLPSFAHHRSSRHRRRTLSCSSRSNHTPPRCILSVRSPARPPRPPTRPDHSILTHSKQRRGRGLCIPSHHSTRRLPCELHRHPPSPRRPRSHSSIRIRPHLLLLQLLPPPSKKSRSTLLASLPIHTSPNSHSTGAQNTSTAPSQKHPPPTLPPASPTLPSYPELRDATPSAP